MKAEKIKELSELFNDHAQHTEQENIEFWFARDVQHLLGYTQYRNFLQVITKAKISCETALNDVSDHFAEVSKKVQLGSGAVKNLSDIMLTRYACYLIAQNGDPKKQEIAFAQNYFAIQTRKLEIIEQRIIDFERLKARKKLTVSEKELSELIFEKTGKKRDFGIIRSKGDKALFGKTTQEMKETLNVPKNRALADFLPTITIKAKDFATEITVFNTRENNLNTQNKISEEHITNNSSVRKILLERGINPELLPPQEDLKKLERKAKAENKRIDKNPPKLEQSKD